MRARRGFSLLELALAMLLVALTASFGLMSLRSSRATAQTRGLAEEVAEELRAARQQAISRQTPVAVAFPSNAGAAAHSQSLYLLEGPEAPRVVRSVQFQNHYPDACVFVGVWGAASRDQAGTGSNLGSFDPSLWSPPAPEDYAVIFTPSGEATSNGLPFFGDAFILLSSHGVEYSPTADPGGSLPTSLRYFAPTALSQPYSIHISATGKVEVRPGAAGLVVPQSPRLAMPAVPPARPLPAGGNSAPAIVDVVVEPEPLALPSGVSSLITRDGYLTLTVVANDPDGDPLSVRWTGTGGRFSAASPNALEWMPGQGWKGTWTWTPPGGSNQGDTYTLTCHVSDPAGLEDTRQVGSNGVVQTIRKHRIAFSGWDPNDDDEESEIYICNSDGTGLVVVSVPGDGHAHDYACFSPDGGQVAFYDDYDEIVWAVNNDGSGLRKLVDLGTYLDYEARPSWSPDSTRLTFAMEIPAGSTAIHQVRADGSATPSLVLTPPAGHDDYGPQWSPAGNWIVFTRSPASGKSFICRVRPDGTGFAQLSQPPASPASSADEYPTWSPNGDQVLFTRDGVVHIIDVPATITGLPPATPLTPSTLEAAYPRFSPDGSFIAFTDYDNEDLYYTRANGDNPTGPGKAVARLTAGAEIEDFCWSPDSDEIVFDSYSLETLKRVNLAGSESRIDSARVSVYGPPSWWGP
ncbi:MAG: prepilin-type N-terminal cleavage/methylation domain-containing protein [Vulcanimicrobiota bacterium]